MATPLPWAVRVAGRRVTANRHTQVLYFHWKTILLPAHIAEYVVVHEMAHLHEPHHTPAFWLRVERAMPDFERRRDWLRQQGKRVEGV
jgi:predicted metal-dependent hydrolase